MAQKTLHYNRWLRVNRYVNPQGVTISQATQYYPDYVYADAAWSRPYPQGCLLPTGLGISETLYDDGLYTLTSASGYKWIGDAQYVYGPTGGLTTNWSTDDGALALAKARHKMAGSDYSFGTSLAEFGDTVDTWRKTASRLYKGFRALKDGRMRQAIDYLKHEPTKRQIEILRNQKPGKRLAQGYLEFQFGWLPQINDAFNVLDVYTKGLSKTGDLVKKRSGMSGRNVDLSNYGDQTGRAVVSGYVRNSRARNLNELGLLNPLAVAWEKMPFSFLADWFIPAGTVLGALTAEAGLSCYSQCVITQKGSFTTYRGRLYRKVRTIQRTPVSGLMAIAPFRPVSLSVGQYMSVAALIRGLSGDSARPFVASRNGR